LTAAPGHGDFLHELREAAGRTDQARLSGDASRIASAEQAEWGLTQAAIDEAGEKEPEAGQWTSQETEPEDPQAAGDWTPGTSRGLPVEIGSAIGDALPWLEAREREARVASDAEARGGRGPSASYAEWAAEGTAGTPAGPQPDGPEAGT